jgi:hypothetical protein
MRTFILRATLSGRTNTVQIDAENDTNAIGVSAMRIISLASQNNSMWAKGHIELINDMGVVLAEMAAK